MWSKLLEYFLSYFKSPSRVEMMDVATKSYELSNRALKELAEVRDQLFLVMAMEMQCKKNLAAEVAAREELQLALQEQQTVVQLLSEEIKILKDKNQ